MPCLLPAFFSLACLRCLPALLQTKIISGNGFNPVWSETFTFPINKPEVAILYLAVHDNQEVAAGVGRHALLAYAAVHVSALRAGYRSCALRAASGKKFPLCSLLIHVQKLPFSSSL